MKYAKDFRCAAREALKGKWGLAVIAGLIASLLGGVSSSNFNFEIDFSNFNHSDAEANIDIGFYEFLEELPAMWTILTPILGFALITGIAVSIGFFILGSIVGVGYASFNLKLIDKKEAAYGDLFAFFSHWKSAVLTNLLATVYIFLWSLLFIIPGIVASYSYAMTDLILAEEPTLSAGEAVAKSKELMKGNRFRLFCLHMSFIGWDLLCILTLGIGELWLLPYKKAAVADFYREISGTHPMPSFDEQTPFADGEMEQI